MTSLRARAPGKLFLLGEYAILDGAPAIVAAVDRYVQVLLETDAACALVSMTSDQSQAKLEFAPQNEPPHDPFFHLATTAYRLCRSAYPRLGELGLRLRMESASSHVGQGKLGFGSSAAICVALVAALLAAANEGELDRHDVFGLALAAHREAQGGQGSGADIAASTFGGLVQVTPRGSEPPRVESLPIPADLHLLAAWTGQSASSPQLIQRYRALVNGEAEVRHAFVASSTSAVERFASAARHGQVALDAIARGAQAMEELVAATKLSILTPELRTLISISRHHGGVAKASGAGGGDCGIALAADQSRRDAITEAWRAAGLLPVSIGISTQGVTVDAA